MDQLDRIDPHARHSAQTALGYMEHNLESINRLVKEGVSEALGRV